MTALFALITFFFIFVLIFITVSATLTAASWWQTRSKIRSQQPERAREIEEKMDRLKDRAFVISMALTFFFITPFIVIYIFIRL